MNITEDSYNKGNVIKAYDENSIQINDQHYSSSLIITPNKLIQDWHIDPNKLDLNDFSFIDELQPRIFIFGTGKKQIFPPTYLLDFFRSRGIGIECMSTGAACRTYTILAAEGRHVAAGLVIF